VPLLTCDTASGKVLFFGTPKRCRNDTKKTIFEGSAHWGPGKGVPEVDFSTWEADLSIWEGLDPDLSTWEVRFDRFDDLGGRFVESWVRFVRSEVNLSLFSLPETKSGCP